MKLHNKKSLIFVILLLAMYVIGYASFLDKSPLVWGDEVALTDMAWSFANEGVPKSHIYGNVHHVEEKIVSEPLLYLALLALYLKLVGLTVMKVRLFSVFFGLVTLLLTFYLAKKFYGEKIAYISSLALFLNPLFFTSARIVREEIVETAFLTAGIYMLLMYGSNKKKRYLIFSGMLLGLTFLSHFIGLVMTTAILLSILLEKATLKNKMKDLLYFIISFGIIILPYIVYIMTNYSLFYEQFFISNNEYARLPSSINHIIQNILNEPYRWTQNGLGTIVSLYPGVIILAYLLLFKKEKENKLVQISILFILLSIFLESTKWGGYFTLLLPCLSIFLGSIIIETYNQFIIQYRSSTLLKYGALLLIFGAILSIDGFAIIYKVHKTSDSNYSAFCDKLTEQIPSKKMILGPPTFWFCFKQNYTGTINLRLVLILDKSFEQVIKTLKIDYFILDPPLKELLERVYSNNFTYLNPPLKEIFKETKDRGSMQNLTTIITSVCSEIAFIEDKYYTTSFSKKDNKTVIFKCTHD